MSPLELVTAAGCAIAVLITLATCARSVMGQVKDKPAPLVDVVTAQGARLAALESGMDEIRDAMRRGAQREAKQRSRGRAPAPVEAEAEPGEMQDDDTMPPAVLKRLTGNGEEQFPPKPRF